MKTIDAKKLADIEASLVGTAQGLSEVAEENGIDENDLIHAIGEHGEIDLCSACGWWCEISELELLPDELICEGCRNN